MDNKQEIESRMTILAFLKAQAQYNETHTPEESLKELEEIAAKYPSKHGTTKAV